MRTFRHCGISFPMILFLVFALFGLEPQGYADSSKKELYPPLPSLTINKERITVSGISSGGFFATQMQIAFSSTIRGSAIVAGGVYGCSLGLEDRVNLCMQKPEEVLLADVLQKTKEQSDSGWIDSTLNLQKAKIVLFFGEKDPVVKKPQLDLMVKFFESFTPPSQVKSILHPEANHAFPTVNYGNPCGKLRLPWISDCDVNFVEDFFRFFDAKEQVRSNRSLQIFKKTIYSENKDNPLWKKFDQSLLSDDRKTAGLAEWGAIYVPNKCKTQECGLHLAFHGCQMNWQYVQNQFIEKAGYLEAADTFGVVVAFPQLEKTKENPNACWDWIGSTGTNYLNKNGPQMKAMGNLIEIVSGKEMGR